jgi:hypothetical protein
MGLVLFCFVALLAAGASAQNDKRDEVNKFVVPKAPATGLDQTMPQIPEEILFRFVDEPSHHFGLAQERFLKKDYAQSAAEIRKGSGFMKLEMTRSANEGEKALADASDRLEKLADGIASGSVASVDDLNAVLARAEQALAFHHEMKAETYWQIHDIRGAGRDLEAASVNLKNSVKYAGGKIDAETEGAIKDADEIAQVLIGGTKLADERVNASFNMLSDKIDEAGSKLEQPKK